jgi:hypothetical protein
MHEPFVRHATAAFNIFSSEILTIGKHAFAGNPSLVEIRQPFPELPVVIAMSHVDRAYTAIKSTGRNKIWI